MTLLEHAGGKTMPKGMGALAGELDARGADMTFHDSRKRGGMRQGVIGRPAGQKNLRVGIRGAGVLQVIQQALSHRGLLKAGGYLCHVWRLGKGFGSAPSRFLPGEAHALGRPARRRCKAICKMA